MDRILAQAGLCLEAGRSAPVARADVWHLWPENVPLWNLWSSLSTQWARVGMEGIPVGLDYAAVWAVLDHSPIPRRKRAWAFEVLQGMEAAVLSEWAKQREAKAGHDR